MLSSEISDAKVDFLSIVQRIAQGVQAVVLGFTEFVNRPEVRAFITSLHEHPQRLRYRPVGECAPSGHQDCSVLTA